MNALEEEVSKTWVSAVGDQLDRADWIQGNVVEQRSTCLRRARNAGEVVSGEGLEVVLVVFEADVDGEGVEELSACEGVPPVFVGEKGAGTKRRLVEVLEDERAELGGDNTTVHGEHLGWMLVCLLWTVTQ